MVYFSIILGLGLLAGMSFLALNKKSDSKVRIASIIALAVMVLTIIVCLFIIFTDTRVPVDESVVIVGAVPQVQEISTVSIVVLVFLIIILIAAFLLVAYLAMRERKNK